MIWKAPKIWEGATAFILGGGPSISKVFDIPEDIVEGVTSKRILPSAYSKYLEPLHDKHIIGINNAYQIGSWLDVLFFGDCSWYLVHRQALAEWPGLKVTCCPRFEAKKKEESEGIKYLKKDSRRKGLSNDSKTVCWNSNSGAAGISLATHFGAKRIVLLGFDMAMLTPDVSHWHGSHAEPGTRLKTPPFDRHMKGFPILAQEAKQAGVEILNCSPNSKIKDFPIVSLKEVL